MLRRHLWSSVSGLLVGMVTLLVGLVLPATPALADYQVNYGTVTGNSGWYKINFTYQDCVWTGYSWYCSQLSHYDYWADMPGEWWTEYCCLYGSYYFRFTSDSYQAYAYYGKGDPADPQSPGYENNIGRYQNYYLISSDAPQKSGCLPLLIPSGWSQMLCMDTYWNGGYQYTHPDFLSQSYADSGDGWTISGSWFISYWFIRM